MEMYPAPVPPYYQVECFDFLNHLSPSGVQLVKHDLLASGFALLSPKISSLPEGPQQIVMFIKLASTSMRVTYYATDGAYYSPDATTINILQKTIDHCDMVEIHIFDQDGTPLWQGTLPPTRTVILGVN